MTDISPATYHEENRTPSRALPYRTGLWTGALLIIVMLGGLEAANRVPLLERYALERNAASYSLFVLFMLIPIFRFFTRPLSMFVSAMIAWVMFVVAYNIAGIVFHNLFTAVRHTPLMVLVEGAAVYGVFAVGLWVGTMILQARHHPIAPSHRRVHEAISRER
jgi:hypothetical protein